MDRICIDIYAVWAHFSADSSHRVFLLLLTLGEKMSKNGLNISFIITCFTKEHRSSSLSCSYSRRQVPFLTGWSWTSWVRCGFCELQ
jgi:hypothetical protein